MFRAFQQHTDILQKTILHNSREQNDAIVHLQQRETHKYTLKIII